MLRSVSKNKRHKKAIIWTCLQLFRQIDSWWYYKGPIQGVTNWTAMNDLFPMGLEQVQQQTAWPLAAHNRYWSGLNDYAVENGGSFHFIIGEILKYWLSTTGKNFLLEKSKTV